jgi:hypothetical protein
MPRNPQQIKILNRQIPKTYYVYNILKEFSKLHDENGNFQQINFNDLFKILKEKLLVTDYDFPLFKRTVTALSTKGYVQPHQGGYILSDDGYLTLLEWEETFSEPNDIIPIIKETEEIRIDKEMNFFISCGERDNEYPIGDWLEEILIHNPNVHVYWWHKYPTDADSDKPTTSQLLKKIMDCDFFISIFHRRYRLPNGLYTTSTACEDELRYAYINKIPRIGFRQKGVSQEGMILPLIEIRAVDNSTEIIHFLKLAIKEYIVKMEKEGREK